LAAAQQKLLDDKATQAAAGTAEEILAADQLV